MRADYAIMGIAVVLLVASMYLAGLSFQLVDSQVRMETVDYAVYLFAASIAMLVFMAIISIIKKTLLKHE